MKISFVVGGHVMPIVVDDPDTRHDSALMIEDENQKYRICLGLDRDPELSKRYMPYYSRILTLEKVIHLRDHLTKLIDEVNKVENAK